MRLRNLFFDPNEPAAGEDKGPDVEMPTDKLAGDLAAANAAEAETDATAETTETVETPAATTEPAAPAAPAEDKTDYKAEVERLKAERDEYATKMAQEAYQQQMAQIASESPEMYEKVYKVKPPPGMFKEQAAAAAPPPKDANEALLRRVEAAEKWQKDQETAIAEAKKQAAINQERQQQSERIYNSLAKHKDVFGNDLKVDPANPNSPTVGDYFSELAVAKFVQALNANPKTANPDTIAADIARMSKAFVEHAKKSYTTAKKETAARIPVGAGAGARQTGQQVGKKTWAQLEKELGDGLKSAERGEDD